MRYRATRGFTLIELVIAVAIIGLLAAIAIPSYKKQIQKSNRAVAKALLTQIAAREESFFADRKAYSTTLAGLNYGGDPIYATKDGSLSATSTTDAIYTVSLTGATATAFTIQAVPANQQAGDTCGTLSLTSIGVRSQTGTLGSLCWKS